MRAATSTCWSTWNRVRATPCCAGIGEDLSELLGVKVDVVTGALLRDPVSVSAHADAVPL